MLLDIVKVQNASKGVTCEFQSHDDISFLRTEILRVYESTTCSKAALGLCIVSFILALSGLPFIFKYRNRPIIMISQKYFLAAFCVGLAGTSFGLLIYTVPQSPGYVACITFNSVFNISLTFLFSVLIAKEYRAFVLDKRTKKLRRLRLGTASMLMLVSAIMSVIIVIDILWFVLDPPMVNQCSFFACSLGHFGLIAWGYLLFLGIVMVVLGAMSYRTGVSSVASESTIIFAIAVTLFVAISIDAVIIFATNVTENQIKLTVAASFFLVTVVAMSMVFRKYKWLHLTSREVQDLFLKRSSRLTQTKSSGPSTRTSGTISGGDSCSSSCKNDAGVSTTTYRKDGLPQQEEPESEDRSRRGLAPQVSISVV